MKTAIAICVGLSILSGCTKPTPTEPTETIPSATSSGKSEWEISISPVEPIPWKFKYVEVDGHEYLAMYSKYRAGIAHSPKCPCLSNHDLVNTSKAN